MKRLALILALASACTGPAAGAAEDGQPDAHYATALVPLVGYSSDTGLGGGLRAAVQRRRDDGGPYTFSVEAQSFMTTGGQQLHFALLDVPRLAGGPVRVDLLAGYDRNSTAAYYGIGNHPVPAADAPTPYDTYLEEYPVLRARVRGALVPGLSVIAGYRLLLQRIAAEPASRLARDAPLGIDGGAYAEASLGVGWDTRDDEMEPTRGALLEATARGTAVPLGSRYASAGAFTSAAGYQAVVPRVVVAGRVALDAAWGDVPFDRVQDFGSLLTPFFSLSGVGGGTTVRGLRQSEYVGDTKAIANAEVRWRFGEVDVWRERVRLSSVVFVDAGRVWQGPDRGPLEAFGVHAGAGGGLRIAWGKLVVLRADVGYAEGTARAYADFRHVF